MPELSPRPTDRAPHRPTTIRVYGSTPGELAACVRNAGLVADGARSVLQVTSSRAVLDAIAAGLIGRWLGVGGCMDVDAVWWCRPTAGRLLLVGSEAAVERASVLFGRGARRYPEHRIAVTHGTREAFRIVGRRTTELLDELEVYGPDRGPRSVSPCVSAPVGGHGCTWLLASDLGAVGLVAVEHATEVRRQIIAAGRDFGLASVGQDALAQYRLHVARSSRTEHAF